MTISAFLPVLFFVLGLVIYFICMGLTKGSVGEIGKWMAITGFLAFLLAAGNSLQSCSVVSTGGGSSSHH